MGNFYTPFYVDILFSGRYAPIFCFYCEHFLFVYIVTQKQKSSSKFNANRILLCGKVFEILIIQKPSQRSYEVPHKIWAQSVQPFWRLLDTNDRQTPRQAKYIYKYRNNSLSNLYKSLTRSQLRFWASGTCFDSRI